MTLRQAQGDRVAEEWPLWEVFVRAKAGLDHKHCGSLLRTTHRLVPSWRRV